MTSPKPLDISVIADPNAKSVHTNVPHKADPNSLVVMASTLGWEVEGLNPSVGGSRVLICPVCEPPAS